MKLFFFLHHKCGSGWFNKINFDLFKAYGRVVHILNENDSNYNSVNDFYEKKKAGFVSFNNADLSFINSNDNFKAIHIVRDPRDIIISAYFSHKKVHPIMDSVEGKAMLEHRKKLHCLNIEEGIKEEILFTKKWYLDKLCTLSNYSSNNILRLKLEDISKDHINSYRRILNFFSLKITDDKQFDRLSDLYYKARVPLEKRGLIKSSKFRNQISNICFEKIMKKNSWENITKGRPKGKLDINSHYRKGVPGDWKNYFNEDIHDMFLKHFGNILDVLDYK